MENGRKYADKYFTRSKQILQKDNLNPWVKAQVFVRKGPGIVAGVDEAVNYLKNETTLAQNGGKVYALKNGMNYSPKETLMVIEGRIDDIIEHETEYLGIISKQMSLANGLKDINFAEVTQNSKSIVDLVSPRPVYYLGARHWDREDDATIAKAALEGGMVNTSTDAGSENIGKKGMGTIPHALENIYAWKDGKENAVVNSTIAFDKHISNDIPRVALIDYNNKEIDDSLKTAYALNGKLSAVRVDTCGENVPQGGLANYNQEELNDFFNKELNDIPEEFKKYWTGTGVTISGVYALRNALDKNNFSDIEILLTSGFASKEKTAAFVDAEKRLGAKLFDGLGVGGVYKSISATMDIHYVGSDLNNLEVVGKTGRSFSPNSRLEEVL